MRLRLENRSWFSLMVPQLSFFGPRIVCAPAIWIRRFWRLPAQEASAERDCGVSHRVDDDLTDTAAVEVIFRDDYLDAGD